MSMNLLRVPILKNVQARLLSSTLLSKKLLNSYFLQNPKADTKDKFTGFRILQEISI